MCHSIFHWVKHAWRPTHMQIILIISHRLNHTDFTLGCHSRFNAHENTAHLCYGMRAINAKTRTCIRVHIAHMPRDWRTIFLFFIPQVGSRWNRTGCLSGPIRKLGKPNYKPLVWTSPAIFCRCISSLFLPPVALLPIAATVVLIHRSKHKSLDSDKMKCYAKLDSKKTMNNSYLLSLSIVSRH